MNFVISVEAGFSPLILLYGTIGGFSQNLIILNPLKLLNGLIFYHYWQ
ncbi:hypothetical protein EMIT036CA2_10575 [Chryseobacterium sp. IT-36CA2]